ncbi:hypothetical protein B0T25DRAFT_527852 [Lasiosphaeria hispida]|uniref:Secreted protein n=1 Tax=Lasiosphaeria hispida TaxID=260671 RepID=A0AAJ0HVA5_9PEZI|nr:hypothetical protein B0T25DRAFT_527852 [Lasiosphaeria hispida]
MRAMVGSSCGWCLCQAALAVPAVPAVLARASLVGRVPYLDWESCVALRCVQGDGWPTSTSSTPSPATYSPAATRPPYTHCSRFFANLLYLKASL